MRYLVSGYLRISVFAEVEAENEQSAAEKALGLCPPSLCHQCSGQEEEGRWATNEFDDTPDDAVQDVELLKDLEAIV